MPHIHSIPHLHTILRTTLPIMALVAAAILLIPLTANAQNPNEFTFTFDSDAEGWSVGFADLPADHDQTIYELDHSHRPLPDGLAGSGIYIQGHNRSDDLFMFLKRQVSGLTPGAEYNVFASIDLATNVPSGSFGIGGAPGESVFVKAGASAVEPATVLDDNQYLRMNIDKGNQAVGGEAMVVIGNVAHPDVIGAEYRVKTLDNASARLTVNADQDGSVWLIVGTDSGYEGFSAFYYSRISYQLTAVSLPPTTPYPTPIPEPTPVPIEKIDVTPVNGATVIQPDERVNLSAGNINLAFPNTSRSRTYQVTLAESDDCGDNALACASLSVHNAEGDADPDARFIFPIKISIALAPDAIDALGGPPVALQAYATNAITLRIRDNIGGEWNETPFNIHFDQNGGMTASTQVHRLGDITLSVNPDRLESARARVSAALGTPTATPLPTPTAVPTATPQPTATPEPTPQPPVAAPPITGDPPIPFGILLALTATAILMTSLGIKTLTARRKSEEPK